MGELGGGGIGVNTCEARAPYQPTKKRTVELMRLGLEVYKFMNKIGIKKAEYY